MKSRINTGQLKPEQLEAVYAISKVASEATSLELAMDEITRLTRSIFIFDNAVLYLREEETDQLALEPLFARAIGRGSSAPESLVWGEVAALEVINGGETVSRQFTDEPASERLNQHYYLGLPTSVGGQINGALVFIRYGGPDFSDDQIDLAEFITAHISQIFERQVLVKRVANLEAERRLAQFQDDFIAMVSHELKTPLGFIKGYTTTLLRKDTDWDAETIEEFLTIIDEETDQLSELIENLLDSSRLQSGTLYMELKPLMLEDFASQILERVSAHYPNMDIQINIEGQKERINIDPKRITQVIENLVNNVHKYAANSPLLISARPEGDQVAITLQDNGPGITEEHAQQIFKRFYRIPERSAGVRGTGLGLFICEHIIKAHQGSIQVESEVGKGTTFKILLPRVNHKDEVPNV